MAWKTRSSGRTYYYRKVWRNGTCHSEYVGQGLAASLSANLDNRERYQRIRQRQELARFKQDQRRVDQTIDEYGNQVRQVVATALSLLGYHQHRRQWRLKRKGLHMAATDQVKEITGEVELDQYFALMRAADDQQGLERFREYARQHPELFDRLGLLPVLTMDAVLNFIAKNESTKIHLRGEANALRRKLGIETATPLEKLLIDNVIFCWLRMMAMEQIYSANMEGGKRVTFDAVLFNEKRLTMVHNRYHRAVESLARTRRLLSRAGVQLNVAQNQVVVNS